MNRFATQIVVFVCLMMVQIVGFAQVDFRQVIVNGTEVPAFYFDLAAEVEVSQADEDEVQLAEGETSFPDLFGEKVLECNQEFKTM